MNKLLIFGLLAASVAAGPTPVIVQSSQDLDCLEHDNALFSCVLVKAISALDRAARSNDIQIIDGVTFVRNAPSELFTRSLSHLNAI